MKRVPAIGFDRRIRLDWLEQAAGLAMLRVSPKEGGIALHEMLKGEMEGGKAFGEEGREKTVLILRRTWIEPREDLQAMQLSGLKLLQEAPPDERLAVHWGMLSATYPFFGTVNGHIGRLLRLQGEVSAPQLYRRLSEDLGDRQIVARAGRHVLRSIVDWGVLCDTAAKGVYRAAPPRPITDPRHSAWLIEGTLRGSQKPSAPLGALIQAPALFPFSISAQPLAALEASGRLDVSRQGMDSDVVSIRPG